MGRRLRRDRQPRTAGAGCRCDCRDAEPGSRRRDGPPGRSVALVEFGAVVTLARDPQPPKTSALGRKPTWQQRWEARSQLKFEQRAVDARTVRDRMVFATGVDGARYVVRAVPNGSALRTAGARGDGIFFLFELVVAIVAATIEAARKRRRTGWTVGVLAPPKRWRAQRVIFRESIDDEAAIAARVREIADMIEGGRFPGARSRGA